nr:hypothetical protein CFP56_02253 [Quercus suber]
MGDPSYSNSGKDKGTAVQIKETTLLKEKKKTGTGHMNGSSVPIRNRILRRGRGDRPEKKEEEETEGIGVREETNFGCKGCSQNAAFQDIVMGISKTEVKLKRLLAAAPQQKNQAKLVHYVATLREQLEQLAQERTSEGLPRVSKAVVNDFLEKIEAIASKLAAPLTTPDTQVSQEPLEETAINESPSKTGENHILPTPRLRRRFVPASNSEDRIHDTAEADSSAPVKLGAAAQAHIEKHRGGHGWWSPTWEVSLASLLAWG